MERLWVKLMSLISISPLSSSRHSPPWLSTPISGDVHSFGDLSPPIFNISSSTSKAQQAINADCDDSQSEASNYGVMTNERAASSASATHSRGPFIQAAFIN